MRIMKIQFVGAAVLALHMISGCTTPPGAGPQNIQEPRHSRSNNPEDTVCTLHAYIAFILWSDKDLFHDETAQEKFLTEDLRRAVAYRWKLYQEVIKKREVHSPPDNGTFVGAWEYPSGYTVEGVSPSANQVVIDVIHKWEHPEHNYYGDTRRVSYTFLSESGNWKLNDAYTRDGEFVRAYSLKNDLWRSDHAF